MRPSTRPAMAVCAGNVRRFGSVPRRGCWKRSAKGRWVALPHAVSRGLESGPGPRCLWDDAADASAALAAACPVARQDDGSVRIRWSDAHESTFHERWLFEHCPQRTSGPGGHKAAAPEGRSQTLISAAAEHGPGGRETVVVEWACGDKSTFEVPWLRAHCYSQHARRARARLRDPLPHALGAMSSIPSVSYSEVMASEYGIVEWTTKLERHGLCVVRDTPCIDGQVKQLASRVAPVMPSLYGDTWNVRVEPAAINVAYSEDQPPPSHPPPVCARLAALRVRSLYSPRYLQTQVVSHLHYGRWSVPLCVRAASQGLGPHMDLAYYESPPGIQLLHCLEFPATVKGGESTFFDTFVLAQLLREREPEAFATLVRVGATFQKSHAERDHPAQMFYTRPHIVTDTGCAAGDVIAVFWSPPFEGPLCAPPEDVIPYYAAYDAFADLMEDEAIMAQHMVSLRLEPGDTVTFNQRRLLHGRKPFELVDGACRHLQGCYLNIDDFLSRHRALTTVGQVRAEHGIQESLSSAGQPQAVAENSSTGHALWGVDWTVQASNGSLAC